MAARNGRIPKKLSSHLHFVTDREQADKLTERCADIGVSPSRALRDAITLWLKHTSESKAVRAYIEERRASLYLEPARRTAKER